MRSENEKDDNLTPLLDEPLDEQKPSIQADDQNTLPASILYPTLHKGLGVLSELFIAAGAFVTVSSLGTEIWQVIQENKKAYNKGYQEGYKTGFDNDEKGFSSPKGFSVIGLINGAQGLIPYVGCYITFIGAKKIATAKNWRDLLLGMAGACTGASCIILNAAFNFGNEYAETYGNYAGKVDKLGSSVNYTLYGVKNIHLPEVPAGYNGIGVAGTILTCGLFSGLTKRLQLYMQRQPTSPRLAG